MIRDFKKRERDVLEIIISRYIETAEPVGSRVVARKLKLSSATIRNVMADLEDAGFITHPYTSAGRMPTDRGYRYYIDSLMHRKSLNDSIARTIEDQYHQTVRSLEDLFERTSHLIATLTNYVGVTLFPLHDKVYLDGTSHFMEQPEFKDVKKLYGLMRCLEERKEILHLLSKDLDDDKLTVHIGREMRSSGLSECGVVTKGYRVKGKMSGRVGVIGPKRMVYERVIPTVELLATSLTNILDELDV